MGAHTIHLIVHDNTGLGDHNLAAKEKVDSTSHRDGKASLVD